jgi:hypothetical protein
MPIMFGEAAHCAFLPRCPYKIDRCYKEPWPGLISCGDNHWAACYAHVERGKEEIRVKTGGECAPSEDQIATDGCNILEVEDLKMYFPVTKVFFRHVADLKAIDGVGFKLAKSETLVGEVAAARRPSAAASLVFKTNRRPHQLHRRPCGYERQRLNSYRSKWP